MPQQFEFEPTGFKCSLESERCQGTTKSGTRCARTTLIGLGFCWNHLMRDKKLRIKESTIPHSGKGLFAMDKSRGENDIVFKKRQTICEYNGETIDIYELNARYGFFTAPYSVELKNNTSYEDGACRRGVGTVPNTMHGKATRRNNAKLVKSRKGTPKIVATRNIRNNKEIFVSYGRTYKLNNGNHATRRTNRRSKTTVSNR